MSRVKKIAIIRFMAAVLLICSVTVSAYANPFKGTAKFSTKQFKLKPGAYLFRVEHKGYSKFEIMLKDSTGKTVSVLAKGVGPYDGKKVVGIPEPPATAEAEKNEEKKEADKKKDEGIKYYIQATEADGQWSVTVMSTGKAAEDLMEFGGDLNSVDATPMFKLNKANYVFNIQHKGGREFEAVLLNEKGEIVTSLAKGIGNIKESKKINIPKAGNYIIEVLSSGKWKINYEESM